MEPEFEKEEGYVASVSKALPPNVPLHFIDSNLTILAFDRDFILPNRDDSDTSCNEIQEVCDVNDEWKDVIECTTEKSLEAEEGVYNVIISFKKRVDYISEDSLNFNVTVKVKEKDFIFILIFSKNNIRTKETNVKEKQIFFHHYQFQ